MSDILQIIQWAEDTIENRRMFGMDDLNAALARESRARGVLSECAEVIKSKDQRIKQLEDALRDVGASLVFYADTEGGAWAACQDTDTAETCCHMVAELSGGKRAREALLRNKEILDTINKRDEE